MGPGGEEEQGNGQNEESPAKKKNCGESKKCWVSGQKTNNKREDSEVKERLPIKRDDRQKKKGRKKKTDRYF